MTTITTPTPTGYEDRGRCSMLVSITGTVEQSSRPTVRDEYPYSLRQHPLVGAVALAIPPAVLEGITSPITAELAMAEERGRYVTISGWVEADAPAGASARLTFYAVSMRNTAGHLIAGPGDGFGPITTADRAQEVAE